MDAFDLPVLFAHRDLLRAPTETPSLRVIGPVPQPKRVALLSGSFNPPTAAHHLIAERARATGCDLAVFVLPRQAAGKQPFGLLAEDRLLALRLMRGAASVAVSTHGLYVDQAQAAARVFPAAELVFLAGSDKVIQIFDPRWYEDRDASLEALFAAASFVVAPRAAEWPQLKDVLDRPENRRFAGGVAVVPLHPSVRDLSSTRVREMLGTGRDAHGLMPEPVASMLRDVGAFAPRRRIDGEIVDPYEVRSRLIDALWEVRQWAERAADLRALVALSTSASPEGAAVRRSFALGGPAPDELLRLQALAGA